ncbi:TRAP transporter small permease [Variovorax sp. LT2P21]|uniref:TRAP transporter small permease n=1 Tax=Variovorax sp. LT2P21 TaxID=3443731 RepID=UPI003F461E95
MQEKAKGQVGAARWVLDISDGVLRCERHFLTVLMGLLMVLVMLNVVTRYGGIPLYWVDEASVYCVVWLTFVGASAMTRLRLDFAVTLLTDKLGAKAVRIAKAAASGGVLVLGLALLAMCWIYMDPVGLAHYGFDAKEFAAESFNFLYTERTQTLNWPVWAIQLILPIFSLTLSVHALSNLIEDLGLQPKRSHAGFNIANADVVN